MVKPIATIRRRERRAALIGAPMSAFAWLLDLATDALGAPDAASGTVAIAWTLSVLLVGGAVASRTYRSTRMGQRRRIFHGEGWAGVWEFANVFGKKGVRKPGRWVRPSLATRSLRDGYKPKNTDYGMYLGKCVTGTRAVRGRKVYASYEKCLQFVGPMGAGKTAEMIHAILDAPGGLVVASTKEELYLDTAVLREEVGPVRVFNPQNVGRAPSTFRWDPLVGCEDWQTAVQRATAMVTGTAAITKMQEASWAAKCIEILATYMLAARLARKDMRMVAHWVANPKDLGAVNFLRKKNDHFLNSAADFLYGEITSEADRMRGSIWSLASSAVKFITNPQIAAACTNVGDDGFDAGQFALDHGTLYLIGDSSDDTIAPLLAALTSYVYDEVKATATRTGRLDPPFGFLLDEVAKITPVPVGAWASDGRGYGLYILIVNQSFDQLITRFGPEVANEVRDIYSKLILGGIQSTHTLKELSDLIGSRLVSILTEGESQSGTGKSRSKSRTTRQEPIMPPEQIRQLPRGFALVLLGEGRAVVVKFKKGQVRAAKLRKRLRKQRARAERRATKATRSSRPAHDRSDADDTTTNEPPARAA